MDTLINHIKRCNYMLRQGNYVADVAYFIGEYAPKMTGVRDSELPQGYSFDYNNAGVLNGRTKIVNGKQNAAARLQLVASFFDNCFT